MAWVLYLTNGRQVLYRVNRRGAMPLWEGEGAPPADRPGTWSMSRLAVLVDLMEEEYRLERLPHLKGSDRRALWSRKRRQLFRDEPLVSATVIGREKDGRRDDRVLFTVLRHTGPFRDWMEAMGSWKVTVRGIWSLPRLSAHWREYSLVDGMRLLVYRCSGRVALRQNYHSQGRLVFSRLSFVAEESLETEGAQELERTWRYLGRLLGLDPGQGVDLQVWAPSFLSQKVYGLWEALPYFRPHCLEMEKIAAGQCWKEALESLALPSYAAWKLTRNVFIPAAHYRDPFLSQLERRNWLNIGLYTGSVGLLAVAAGYGAVTEGQMLRLKGKVERLRLQKQALTTLVQNLPEPFAVDGMNPWELESLIDLKKQVDKGMISPRPLLQLVSSALGRFPDFELSALAWQRPPAEEQEEQTDGAESSLEDPLMLTFTLKAPLHPGQVRHLVEQVGNLVSWLESQPKVVTARIGESSIPLKEDEPVKGQFGGMEKINKLAIFTLEIEYFPSGVIGEPPSKREGSGEE